MAETLNVLTIGIYSLTLWIHSYGFNRMFRSNMRANGKAPVMYWIRNVTMLFSVLVSVFFIYGVYALLNASS